MNAIRVTITSTAQAYSLWNIISGVAAAGYSVAPSGGFPAESPNVRELTVQNDPSSGAAKAYLGGSAVVASGGFPLANGDSMTVRSTVNSIPLKGSFVIADTNPTVVNILWDTL